VGFLLQNFPRRDRWTADLRVSQAFRRTQTAQLALRFIATEQHDGVRLECVFNTDLFEMATIEALLAFYGEVIEIVARHPDIPLRDISLPLQLQTQVMRALTRLAADADATAENEALEQFLETVECMSEDEVTAVARVVE
jgi:hypothetical protein